MAQPSVVGGYAASPMISFLFNGCARSVFALHNDTVNVWSHLLPGVACVVALLSPPLGWRTHRV
eukprot:gene2854-4243_t